MLQIFDTRFCNLYGFNFLEKKNSESVTQKLVSEVANHNRENTASINVRHSLKTRSFPNPPIIKVELYSCCTWILFGLEIVDRTCLCDH